LDDDRGDWTLAGGGTIEGGAIVAAPGRELIIHSGVLDGVRLDTDLDISKPGSSATLRNGTLLNRTARLYDGSVLNVDGGGLQTLGGMGTVAFLPGASASTVATSAAALQIASKMSIVGAGGLIGGATIDVTNNGRIEATEPGPALSVSAKSGVNNGEIVASAADIHLTGAWANNFLLHAKPGRALEAGDSLNLNVPGTLAVEISSLTSFGRLLANGHVSFAGTLIVSLVGDYVPEIGDSFRVIEFASSSGAFHVVRGLAIGNGALLQQAFDATGLTLTVIAE
jgi:hypothetical protein